MSAPFYVEVIGSVDQCYIGPFADKAAADAFVAKVPKTFDASVMTSAEKDSSFRKYGALPICDPASYSFEE